MRGILSNIWPTAPAPKPVQTIVPAKAEDKKSIYFRNEKGWPCYNIELLTNQTLCDVANTECRSEAGLERNRAMTDAIEGTVLAVGIVVAAVVVAKLACLFFVTLLINISMANGFSFQPITFFVTRVLTHTATYIGAGVAIHKLWSSIYGSIQDHWDAAKHLDDLGIKALLRKASFEESPPARSSTSTDWQ